MPDGSKIGEVIFGEAGLSSKAGQTALARRREAWWPTSVHPELLGGFPNPFSPSDQFNRFLSHQASGPDHRENRNSIWVNAHGINSQQNLVLEAVLVNTLRNYQCRMRFHVVFQRLRNIKPAQGLQIIFSIVNFA